MSPTLRCWGPSTERHHTKLMPRACRPSSPPLSTSQSGGVYLQDKQSCPHIYDWLCLPMMSHPSRASWWLKGELLVKVSHTVTHPNKEVSGSLEWPSWSETLQMRHGRWRKEGRRRGVSECPPLTQHLVAASISALCVKLTASHSHVSNEKKKAQSGEVSCPKTHSKQVTRGFAYSLVQRQQNQARRNDFKRQKGERGIPQRGRQTRLEQIYQGMEISYMWVQISAGSWLLPKQSSPDGYPGMVAFSLVT